MKHRLILFATLFCAVGFAVLTYAGAGMEKQFVSGGFFVVDMYPIKNPIRTHIHIESTPEDIQRNNRVVLKIEFENPPNSGEIATFNTRLSYRDIALLCQGELIGRSANLPTEPKPRPLEDKDFKELRPGDKQHNTWTINLDERAMLKGTHQYEIFLAGNHALPSVISKIDREYSYKKYAMTPSTKSNTVTFTYTYPSTTEAPIPATPTEPAKRDGADDLRLPLGTKVSSLKSCPETGVYECPLDAPGVEQRRLFLSKGRPMPGAFAMEPKTGLLALFSGREKQEVETIWTLVSYDNDAR